MTITLLVILAFSWLLFALYVRDTNRERAKLLQRIQAPERAVQEYVRPNVEPAPVISLEDDEAFAKLREQRMMRSG